MTRKSGQRVARESGQREWLERVARESGQREWLERVVRESD